MYVLNVTDKDLQWNNIQLLKRCLAILHCTGRAERHSVKQNIERESM